MSVHEYQGSKPLVGSALQHIDEILREKPADMSSALSPPLTRLFYNAPCCDYEFVALTLYEFEERYGVIMDPPDMWSEMQAMRFGDKKMPPTQAVLNKRNEKKAKLSAS